jgi:hypothetical protein
MSIVSLFIERDALSDLRGRFGEYGGRFVLPLVN